MLLDWCQNSEPSLVSLVVVVINIVFNHRHEFFTATEAVAIVSFSFKDPPEPFHWPIVDALGYARHALCHSSLLKLVVERPVGVLESAVAVIPNSG